MNLQKLWRNWQNTGESWGSSSQIMANSLQEEIGEKTITWNCVKNFSNVAASVRHPEVLVKG